MWDRDPFFKKDFLGLVSFSLDELKKNSAEPTVRYHPYIRVAFYRTDRSGQNWYPLQNKNGNDILQPITLPQ